MTRLLMSWRLRKGNFPQSHKDVWGFIVTHVFVVSHSKWADTEVKENDQGEA